MLAIAAMGPHSTVTTMADATDASERSADAFDVATDTDAEADTNADAGVTRENRAKKGSRQAQGALEAGSATEGADTTDAITKLLRSRMTRRWGAGGGVASSALSDGSIHWLREQARNRHGFQALRILVESSAGAFGAVGAHAGFNIHPPAAQLTQAQAIMWSSGPFAAARTFLSTAAVRAFFAANAVGAFGPVANTAAFPNLGLCHASIVGILAGAVATEAAASGVLTGLGAALVCNCGGQTYAVIKPFVTVDVALRAYNFDGANMFTANGMEQLAAAYPAINAVAANALLDWTFFDGWWYGTAHGGVGAGGYRLEQAFGRVEDYVSSNARNPTTVDREYMRRDDHVPGLAPIFGKHAVAPGPPILVADDAGHVKANQFGGEREPINFVPESPLTNQVLFRKAENLATWVATKCPLSRINMYVFYRYVGAALRPNFIQTQVKVEGVACNMPGNYGTLPLNTVVLDATVPNT